MALHDPALRDLYDLKVYSFFYFGSSRLIFCLKIFVQADSDLMLARRLTRDVKERGRSVDGILEQYARPMTFLSYTLLMHLKVSTLCQARLRQLRPTVFTLRRHRTVDRFFTCLSAYTHI